MGKRGPAPKPTTLKVVDDTFRPDRAPEEPVQTSAAPPKPARYLTPRAKQIFKIMVAKLSELGLATASHGEALNLLVLKLWEVEHFRAKLRRGYTYKTKNTGGHTVTKVRPEVQLLKEAVRDAKGLLTEFGLTPSSCGGIDLGLMPGTGKKPPAARGRGVEQENGWNKI